MKAHGFALPLILLAASASCASTSTQTATQRPASEPAARPGVDAPVMVEVEPDLWVIEGRESPTFFVDPSFWMYRAGRWYRSGHLGAAWSFARPDDVPDSLPDAADASAFARYAGSGSQPRRVLVPYHPARADDVGAERRGDDTAAAASGETEDVRDLHGLATERTIWAPYPDPIPAATYEQESQIHDE